MSPMQCRHKISCVAPALIEAARDAGAGRWQTMVEIVIPLSKTGIALGSILVFTQFDFGHSREP
jgi:putative spermidine/putrescine transport system permease protein